MAAAGSSSGARGTVEARPPLAGHRAPHGALRGRAGQEGAGAAPPSRQGCGCASGRRLSGCGGAPAGRAGLYASPGRGGEAKGAPAVVLPKDAVLCPPRPLSGRSWQPARPRVCVGNWEPCATAPCGGCSPRSLSLVMPLVGVTHLAFLVGGPQITSSIFQEFLRAAGRAGPRLCPQHGGPHKVVGL